MEVALPSMRELACVYFSGRSRVMHGDGFLMLVD
jgi:hypothetical protein